MKTAIVFGMDGDKNASRRCDKVDALVSNNDCPGKGFLSSRKSPWARDDVMALKDHMQPMFLGQIQQMVWRRIA